MPSSIRAEEATAAALAALPSSWIVIHDVVWPGRKLANIDHIVVGPAGVFVIDSKNWSGRAASRAAAVRSAAASAEAVAALIPEIDVEHVQGVLCFGTDVEVDRTDGVIICSTNNLVPMMTSRPAVVSDATVRAITASLPGLLSEKVAMGAPVTLAMPRAEPRRRKRRSSAGRSVGTAAAAAAAIALVVVVSNGLMNQASDQPPGDQQIQPEDKQDKKKNKNKKGEQQKKKAR